jgi:hypothetical protein
MLRTTLTKQACSQAGVDRYLLIDILQILCHRHARNPL